MLTQIKLFHSNGVWQGLAPTPKMSALTLQWVVEASAYGKLHCTTSCLTDACSSGDPQQPTPAEQHHPSCLLCLLTLASAFAQIFPLTTLSSMSK